MELQQLTDKDFWAGASSIAGGVLRILLNVDSDIPKKKQFVLLFFAALPIGWSAYLAAFTYGYEVLAFPAGFFAGLTALSIASQVAREGAKSLLSIFIKKV